MIRIKNIITLVLIAAAGLIYAQQPDNRELLNPGPHGNTLNEMDFVKVNTGYAVNSSGKIIYKTTDGGKTWLNQIVPAKNQIKPIIKVRKSTGSVLKREVTNEGLIAGNPIIEDKNEGFMPLDDYTNSAGGIKNIRFTLQQPGFVSIKIYDKAGNTIDELAKSSFGAGDHEVKWNSEKFKSGGYFYSIVTSEFSETKKMNLKK